MTIYILTNYQNRREIARRAVAVWDKCNQARWQTTDSAERARLTRKAAIAASIGIRNSFQSDSN